MARKKLEGLRLPKVKELCDPLGGPRPSVRHLILEGEDHPPLWSENPVLEHRLHLSSREGEKEKNKD